MANHEARRARLAAKLEAAMLRNRRKHEAAAQRLKELQEKVVSAVRRIASPHTRP